MKVLLWIVGIIFAIGLLVEALRKGYENVRKALKH